MSDPLAIMEPLVDQGILQALDLEVGRFLRRVEPGADPRVVVLGILAANSVSSANSCVELGAIMDEFPWLRGLELPWSWREEEVMDALGSSTLVGDGKAGAPLVLDGRRLYLRRYFIYETSLARQLLELASRTTALEAGQVERAREVLARFFALDGGCDLQRVGAITAVTRGLCVITGGPGTGKTRSVAAVCALARALWPGVRIALAAPTGKAAVRMAESLEKGFREVGIPPQQEGPVTLHRLLGADGRGGFRHGPDRPIPYDLVVLDEASMVDLPMMYRLVTALPSGARLVMLGDRDQLASVEAGNVLADICRAAGEGGYSRDHAAQVAAVAGDRLAVASGPLPPLRDCVVELTRNFRFGPDSPLGRLAVAVREGRVKAALELLQDSGAGGIELVSPARMGLEELILQRAMGRFRTWLQCKDLHRLLDELGGFRLLSGLREGPAGAGRVNHIIANALMGEAQGPVVRGYFPGLPVMITRNSYLHGLFNGDTGVIWPDGQGGLAAFFSPSGDAAPVPLAIMPAHETAYCITVHKSQGSEFDEVLLLLPQADSPLLTRELLYTGITRARMGVVIWGEPEAVAAAISRPTRRFTGLADRLAGRSTPSPCEGRSPGWYSNRKMDDGY